MGSRLSRIGYFKFSEVEGSEIGRRGENRKYKGFQSNCENFVKKCLNRAVSEIDVLKKAGFDS